MEQVYSRAAGFYDKLYAGKDYAGEVQRLISILGKESDPDNTTLLDVACGTGLHMEHLIKHFHVEGLDICPELLEIARDRLPGVRFHLGDMTDFNLGRRFDIVTCLFSSIGYVKTSEGLKAAVNNMVSHLNSHGVLVIEPWFTPDRWHPDTVHGIYIDEPDLKIARINTSCVENGVSVFDLHHLIGTPEGTEHLVEHHELGLFEVARMMSAMEEAGLRVRFDDHGLNGRGLYIGAKSG